MMKPKRKRKPNLKLDTSGFSKAVRRYNLQISLGRRHIAPELIGIIPPFLDLEQEISALEGDSRRMRLRMRELEKMDWRLLVPREMGSRAITEYEYRQIQKETQEANREAAQLLGKVRAGAAAAGRFPTERSRLLEQIGYKEGDPLNYARLVKHYTSEGRLKQAEQWRSNYLAAVDRQLEYIIQHYDGSKEMKEALDLNLEIYKYVAGMDIQQFVTRSLIFDVELDIEFIYLTLDKRGANEKILKLWKMQLA